MDRPTEAARALIDASEHAIVATIEPGGQPQLSVVTGQVPELAGVISQRRVSRVVLL